MTIYIEDERTEGLVEELTRRTGKIDLERVKELLARLDALPDLDNRTPDEIMGYGPDGLP